MYEMNQSSLRLHIREDYMKVGSFRTFDTSKLMSSNKMKIKKITGALLIILGILILFFAKDFKMTNCEDIICLIYGLFISLLISYTLLGGLILLIMNNKEDDKKC